MGYPSAAASFTTKNTGDSLQPSHINDLQTEVVAVETNLLSGWTSVEFSASHFGGLGGQTWTVESGDQYTFAYRKLGRSMTIAFTLRATTVGGTPSAFLTIAIPGGYSSARYVTESCYLIENGTPSAGFVISGAVGDSTFLPTRLHVSRSDAANFTATSGATTVFGQIEIETTA